MDDNDWSTAGDILEDMPPTLATFIVLVIVVLCLLGWYAFSSNACMDTAKQAHMPYYDYSFGKGCVVGQAPPQLAQDGVKK